MGLKHTQLNVLSCLFLVAATLALYSPALHYPFANYDDQHYVTANRHVQAGVTEGVLAWSLTSTEEDNWHPLTWLSHALDCQIYGLNPGGHHATSVLLHAANVVLLFWFLFRATSALGRSLLVSALFAVHPLNVESVVWIAERKNVLSTFFFLLTLGAYGWYSRRPGALRYLLVATLFVLGLASKPMVITLPFVLLLLDLWPLRRIQGKSAAPTKEMRRREAKIKRVAVKNRSRSGEVSVSQSILEKLPLLVMCAASAWITVIAQQRGGAVRTLQRFPFWWRAANAVHAYAAYLGKTVWPTRLAVYYPMGHGLGSGSIILASAFLVGVSLLAWRERRRRSYLIVGWLWYLGTLVPVIGLVQIGDQAMADRYAYIPLIGVFVMVAWGSAELADRAGLDLKFRCAISAVVLAALFALSLRQISFWRSDFDLWTHDLAVTHQNSVAAEGLSSALLVMGRPEEALAGFQEAVRANPRDPFKHVNLGADLAQCGRVQDAIKEYQAAISMTTDPHIQGRCYDTLATFYDELEDYARVRESYRQAVRVDPHEIGELVRELAANVPTEQSAPRYLQLGLLQEEAGDLEGARAAYEQAIQLDSGFQEAKEALAELRQNRR